MCLPPPPPFSSSPSHTLNYRVSRSIVWNFHWARLESAEISNGIERADQLVTFIRREREDSYRRNQLLTPRKPNVCFPFRATFRMDKRQRGFVVDWCKWIRTILKKRREEKRREEGIIILESESSLEAITLPLLSSCEIVIARIIDFSLSTIRYS